MRDARFRSFVDGAPDAVVIADRTGIIVIANESAATLFGYPRDALEGQPIGLLLPERFYDGNVAGCTTLREASRWERGADRDRPRVHGDG